MDYYPQFYPPYAGYYFSLLSTLPSYPYSPPVYSQLQFPGYYYPESIYPRTPPYQQGHEQYFPHVDSQFQFQAQYCVTIGESKGVNEKKIEVTTTDGSSAAVKHSGRRLPFSATKGQFRLHSVREEASTFKRCKVRSVQFDTIKLELETTKLINFIKIDVGNMVMVPGRCNRRRVGIIKNKAKHKGSAANYSREDLKLVDSEVEPEFKTQTKDYNDILNRSQLRSHELSKFEQELNDCRISQIELKKICEIESARKVFDVMTEKGWAASKLRALVSSEGLAVESKLSTASAIITGSFLGIYEDNTFQSESKKPSLKSVNILGLGTVPEIEKKLKYAEDVCTGVIFGKELVNAPTNVLAMIPLASTVASQLCYLLQSLSASNSDVVLQELYQYTAYGIEGNILLLQTCLDYLNIYGRDLKNVQLEPVFTSVFRHLLEKPNFSTIFCDSLRSTTISEEFLQNLSSALQLSTSENIRIGLALVDSENTDVRMCGKKFCMGQIGELWANQLSVNSAEQVQNIFMFLNRSEGLSKHVDSFMQMLSLVELKARVEFILAPLLANEVREANFLRILDMFDESSEDDFDAILAEMEREMSRASITTELGYGCTKNISQCKEILSLYLPLTEVTVARILGTIARTCTGLEDNQNVFSTFRSALGALAEEAKKIAALYSDVFSATILDVERCKALKKGSYLGVVAASTSPPHFIHLCYKPPDGQVKTKLALVGKRLTFDSGGYNIKTGLGCSIELMKFEMGGSTAVLGAAETLGQIKPAGVEVRFVVAACENMISATWLDEDDFLTAYHDLNLEDKVLLKGGGNVMTQGQLKPKSLSQVNEQSNSSKEYRIGIG